MSKAKNIQYMVFGSNSRTSFLIWIGPRRSGTARTEKEKEKVRNFKGSGKGKSSKGGVTRNPNNGRFQTNTVQVQDGEVEPGFESAERSELPGNQPHRVLTVAQNSETAQSMSFEEVSVAEENATPLGTS